METPPTRLFAVMDAEGRYKLPEQRERERDKLIERILLTFPKRFRTESVADSIKDLVTIETWNAEGDSFEFAHFTDRQIAVAVGEVYVPPKRGKNPPPLPRRTAAVANLRRKGGNLETMLGNGSKVDLADALWPVLRAQDQACCQGWHRASHPRHSRHRSRRRSRA